LVTERLPRLEVVFLIASLIDISLSSSRFVCQRKCRSHVFSLMLAAHA